MGKQGVLLEDGVDLPLVGRDIIDPHTVEEYVARGGLLKPADDAQGGGLATSGGTEQCEELLVIDIEIDRVQNDLVVEHHFEIRQADKLFGHVSSPIPIKWILKKGAPKPAVGYALTAP